MTVFALPATAKQKRKEIRIKTINNQDDFER